MRIVYAAPREVGDMDESVNTAKVNKHTVRGDVLDCTLENLTLLELADNLLLLCFQFLLDESLVGNNNVAVFLVDLHNLEFHCLAYELVVVAYWVNVNLAAGQECLDTEYVNDHTTLSAALDVALDNLLVVESSINALPALAQACLLVRKQQLALLVFLVLYVNLYLVAYLQVGIVAELACRDDTIALVADVYDYFFLVARNNGTLSHLMLADLVESLVVSSVKLFLADVDRCAIFKLFPIEVVQWLDVFC